MDKKQKKQLAKKIEDLRKAINDEDKEKALLILLKMQEIIIKGKKTSFFNDIIRVSDVVLPAMAPHAIYKSPDRNFSIVSFALCKENTDSKLLDTLLKKETDKLGKHLLATTTVKRPLTDSVEIKISKTARKGKDVR